MANSRRKKNKNSRHSNRLSVYNKVEKQSDIDMRVVIEDKEIDISEELVVAFTMNGIDYINNLLNYVFTYMTEEELEIISRNLKRMVVKDLLIWSASNAGFGIERAIILAILTSKTKLARTCLAALADGFVYKFKQYDKIDGAQIKEYAAIDLDKYAFAVTMEWAIQNKFITKLKFDITETTGIDTYLDFKTGKISQTDFIKYLVTGNGKLPLPIDDELYTNPNYSWSGFESEKNLEDAGLEDRAILYIQSIFQRYYNCIRAIVVKEANIHLYGRYAIIHSNKYKNTKHLLSRAEDNNAKLEEKYKGLRSTLKKLRKDNRNTVDELHRATNKINTLEKECKAFRDSSVTIKELENIKSCYETKCNELNDELIEKNKLIGRQINEIDELRKENNKLRVEKETIENSFKAYKESSNTVNSNIPMECIIKSIKDRKIVIIGGDLTHNKIRRLGFDNVRLIGTDRRSVSASELANADVIVFFVTYLAHSFMEFPKQYAIQNNITIIYFTGKNLELLCNELFMHFYK